MSQLGHFGILFLFAVFVWGVSSHLLASRLPAPTSTSTPSTSTRPSTYYNFLTNRWITTTTKGPHPYSPTWPYNFFTNRWIITTTKGPSHPYPATSSYNYLTNRWTTTTTKGPSHPDLATSLYNYLTNRWITTTTKGPSHPDLATSSYNYLTNRWTTTTTKGPSHPDLATSSYNYLTNRWITTTTKGPFHPYSPTWPYNFFTNQWITTTKGPSHPYSATSPFMYNYLTNQWITSTRTTNPHKTIPYKYSKSQWIGEPRVSPTASQYSTTTAEKLLSNEATLLHQILIQETSLRVELQKTVWDLMKDFEQMKKNQIEEKSDQDTINRQLINNITSLRSENKKLKDELLVLQQQTPNKSSNTGLHSYHDFTNVSKELQSFKREFRYFSLGFLDIQQDIDRINTQQENVTTAMKDIRDVKDILVRVQHKQFEFSTDLENLKTNQTDMLVRVAFTATRTQSLSFLTAATLVFSNILTNIGGGYNAVTGIFTAPLGGLYVFNCKLTDNLNSDGPTIYFVKNGASQGFNVGNEGPRNSFRSSSSSIVLELIPGDRVWVKVVGSSFFSSITIAGEQMLTGFLL